MTSPGPAWDAGGWKWVPAALLHPALLGCLYHILLGSRGRCCRPATGQQVQGIPFPGAPAQLQGKQSREEPVLACAQRPSPKGRRFVSDQFIKMVLSPFKALWGICAFPRCRNGSVCVSPSLFRPREKGAWQRWVTFCSQYCDANKLWSSSRQSRVMGLA